MSLTLENVHDKGAATVAEAIAIDTSPKKRLVRAWSYSALAWEFPICIGVGFGVGRWLDEKFVSEPVCTIVGVVFGVAAGFRSLIRAAKRAQRDLR